MIMLNTLSKVVAFVRPEGGRQALGQAHVPLLTLMPRRSSDANDGKRPTGSQMVR